MKITTLTAPGYLAALPVRVSSLVALSRVLLEQGVKLDSAALRQAGC